MLTFTRSMRRSLAGRSQRAGRTAQIVGISIMLTLVAGIGAQRAAFAQAVPGVKTASDAIFKFVTDNAMFILLPLIGLGACLFFGIGFSRVNRERGMTFMGGGIAAMIFIYVLAKPIVNLILTAVGQPALY